MTDTTTKLLGTKDGLAFRAAPIVTSASYTKVRRLWSNFCF